MVLLGDVPARRPDGRAVPTARWERIGRAAGVVRDGDWDTHLPRYAAEARRARTPSRRPWRPRSSWPSSPSCEACSATRPTCGRGPTGPSGRRTVWSAGSGRAVSTASRAPSASAWEQTWRVLDRLHHLDTIGQPVTRAEFRATFVAELEITPGRQGKVGDGVHVSTLAGAAGLDVDVAVVLGAADGLVPPPPVVDPLLGDHERRVAGLEGSDERAAAVHRQFLAAVAATPAAFVTVPRGDLRATAQRHPSRWITELVAAATGANTVSERSVDSHAHGLAQTVFPVSPAEHRVRELWTRVRAGEDVRDLPAATADPVLGRAAAAARRPGQRRASPTYDGDLSSRQPLRIARAVSPTRIEMWAKCPHAYFMQYVLGVRPIDEPDAIESLSPLDRGSAIHAAIDMLHTAVLDGTIEQPGPDGWTDVHAAALRRAGERRRRHAARHRAHRPHGVLGQRAGRSARRARPVAGVRPARLERAARAPVRAGLREGRARRAAPSRRTGDRLRGADRPRRRAARRDDRRHRPQDGQRRRPRQGLSRRIRRWGRPASSSRSTPPPPAPCSAGPTPRSRAEYTFFKPDFKRVGLTFDDEVWKRVAAGPGARRRRHRGRRLPGRAGAPDVPALRRMLVLRTRRPRHRRSLGRMGAQAARPVLAPWFADLEDGPSDG